MKERLQKIISAAGIASRRRAEELISEGEVLVNGKLITELGAKADGARDRIIVAGSLLKISSHKLYIALHKPTGFISTLADPQGRKTVKDLLKAIDQRVFPVGRLDYDSEGLILLTNDGDFAFKIAHPKFQVPKRYLVQVAGEVTIRDLVSLRQGIVLEDGPFKVVDAVITKSTKKTSSVLLTIVEGRNRVIRRAFAKLGFVVERLVRVSIGTITVNNIKAGEFRYLSKVEVKSLLSIAEKRG
ncbi:MAG: rRNA pseudouridine synthase [Deltaproteobacteria bacterium]|nr:rRNA pseudouridine synthase [Deltaproteobacteria bacterium]